MFRSASVLFILWNIQHGIIPGAAQQDINEQRQLLSDWCRCERSGENYYQPEQRRGLTGKGPQNIPLDIFERSGEQATPTKATSFKVVGGITILPSSHPSCATGRVSSFKCDTSSTTLETKGKVIGESRIVGGTPVAADAYPFYGHTTGTELCGSTLIHEDFLLTAAHCQGNFVGVGFGVSLGGNQRFLGTRVTPVQEFPHPDFIDPFNDIMLVKLQAPASAPVEPINFDTAIPATGDDVTVIGYGHTVENGTASDALLGVTVQVQADFACSSFYTNWDGSIMICAGIPAGGKDSCQGDSGGPLFDQAGVQIGVVSFGNGCARPNTPSGYVRLSAYSDWIQSTLCENSGNPPVGCSRPGNNTSDQPSPSLVNATSVPGSSEFPSGMPSQSPSATPVPTLSEHPSSQPSISSQPSSSSRPSASPSASQSASPSESPSSKPPTRLTVSPSLTTTSGASITPSPVPSAVPSGLVLSESPSSQPFSSGSNSPSSGPVGGTLSPTVTTSVSSLSPSASSGPTAGSTGSDSPSLTPSSGDTNVPTTAPSLSPRTATVSPSANNGAQFRVSLQGIKLSYAVPGLTGPPSAADYDQLLQATKEFYAQYFAQVYSSDMANFTSLDMSLVSVKFYYTGSEYNVEVVYDMDAGFNGDANSIPSSADLQTAVNNADYQLYVSDFVTPISAFSTTTSVRLGEAETPAPAVTTAPSDKPSRVPSPTTPMPTTTTPGPTSPTTAPNATVAPTTSAPTPLVTPTYPISPPVRTPPPLPPTTPRPPNCEGFTLFCHMKQIINRRKRSMYRMSKKGGMHGSKSKKGNHYDDDYGAYSNRGANRRRMRMGKPRGSDPLVWGQIPVTQQMSVFEPSGAKDSQSASLKGSAAMKRMMMR